MITLIKGLDVWWQKPGMRTDADFDIERKTSWLELFWDLMFAAIIGEAADLLHVYHGISGIANCIFLFIPVWWIWNGVTFYNERFEMNDVRHRILTFV